MVCTCATGYSGADCSHKICPGASSECSGHGACHATSGACSCTTGWTGSDCATEAVSSPKACPDDCSSHGTCNEATGVCACASGYTGSNCATAVAVPAGTTTLVSAVTSTPFTVGDKAYVYYTLPNVPSSASVVITVTATTGDPDVYVSSAAAKPSKSNYEKKSTGTGTEIITITPSSGSAARNFGIAIYGWGASTGTVTAIVAAATCDAATTCSGHGSCSSGGSCSCAAGWTGSSCNTPDCPGSPDCNGRGTCSSSGTCQCNTGFTGTACETDATPTPVTPPSSGTIMDQTMQVGSLTQKSWYHFKITISGASSTTQQTMKMTLTRANTASDPMMFIRKGSRPAVSASGSFSYSKFDQSSWQGDKLTQVVELGWPDLTDGEYYVGVYNYDRYVQATCTGASVRVEIAKPDAAQASAMIASCNCNGHGLCAYGADNKATCRCEPGWKVNADCSVGASALTLGTAGASATLAAAGATDALWYFDVTDANEMTITFKLGAGTCTGCRPQIYVQKSGFNAAGDAPSAATGAFTDYGAWKAGIETHTIRLNGGELANGRYYVAVSAGPGAKSDMKYTLSAVETVKASTASKEICGTVQAMADKVSSASLSLTCPTSADGVEGKIVSIGMSDWSSGPFVQAWGGSAWGGSCTAQGKKKAKYKFCRGVCGGTTGTQGSIEAMCVGKKSCTVGSLMTTCGAINLGDAAGARYANDATLHVGTTATAGSGTLVDSSGSDFGPKVVAVVNKAVVRVGSGDGCDSTAITEVLTGKVAVITRGGCTFVAKAKAAQAKGAVAVIIVNNKAGETNSVMGGTDAAVTIPARMVSQDDGKASALPDGVTISITHSALADTKTLCDGVFGTFPTVYDLVVTATCATGKDQVCVDGGDVTAQTCRGHGTCGTVNGQFTCTCQADANGQMWMGSDCNTPAATLFEAPRMAAGVIREPKLTAAEASGAEPTAEPAKTQVR